MESPFQSNGLKRCLMNLVLWYSNISLIRDSAEGGHTGNTSPQFFLADTLTIFQLGRADYGAKFVVPFFSGS